jgi:GNAT superfamily N-acetyltransferase
MTTNAPPQATRAVLLFHRPIDDPYHGSSRLCREFSDRLSSFVPLAFVGPPLLPRRTSGNRDVAAVRLTALRYLLVSTFAAIRFIQRDGLRSSQTRTRVMIAFDVYLAGIAAVWSRIRRIDLVFFPQDSGRAVARDWARSRIRGAWLFRGYRAIPERLALKAARQVLVPSMAVEDEYVRAGVPRERLQVCPVNRRIPVLHEEKVDAWRRSLGLSQRQGVVFVGSFQYPPNVRAFDFIRTVLAPELQIRDPSLLILVVGLDSESFAKELPNNLRVLGTVADLDGLLFACSIGIAPMEVAGGTSLKVIDFLLHGLPTVATPEAAQGVVSSPNLHTASLAAFAEAVMDVARETRERTPDHARPQPDREFVQAYTESTAMEAIGAEIRLRASDTL